MRLLQQQQQQCTAESARIPKQIDVEYEKSFNDCHSCKEELNSTAPSAVDSDTERRRKWWTERERAESSLLLGSLAFWRRFCSSRSRRRRFHLLRLDGLDGGAGLQLAGKL